MTTYDWGHIWIARRKMDSHPTRAPIRCASKPSSGLERAKSVAVIAVSRPQRETREVCTPVTAPPVSMAVDWIVPKPTNKGKRYMTFSRRSLIGAATAAAVTPLIRPRAQGAPTIKIGVLNDMSGPYLNITGTTSIVCCKQALEDFGVSGKGLNVEVISADHQNKPDLAVSIARQWFDRDGVDVILDVPTSSVALAVQGVVREKNKVFLASAGATAGPDR